MSLDLPDTPACLHVLNRRQWILGAAGLALATNARADDSVEDDEAAILQELDKVGLKGIGSSRSDHFLAVGDAPSRFRDDAVKLCERLATTVVDHFKSREFEVALPDRPLAIVVLSNRAAYEKYLRERVDDNDGGHYDLATNRLVVYDFKNSARANTFTLVHEAIHELTFNIGLLSRRADVPLAVSEGLATYGELWQNANPRIGQVNRLRLDELKSSRNGREWVSVEELVAQDGLFEDPETVLLAYAESWLLIHELMSRSARDRANLRAYLVAIRTRIDAKHRLDDAAAAFGDLIRLDRDLKKRAIRLIRG